MSSNTTFRIKHFKTIKNPNMKFFLRTLALFLAFVYISCNRCLENTDAVITLTATDFYTLKPIKGCTLQILQQYGYSVDGRGQLVEAVISGDNGVTPSVKVKFTDDCENPSKVCFAVPKNDTAFLLKNPDCLSRPKGDINRTFSVKQKTLFVALKLAHKNGDSDSLNLNMDVNGLKLYSKSINEKAVFDSIYYFKTFPEERLNYSYSFITKNGVRQSIDTSVLPTYFNDTFRLQVSY